MEKLKEQYAEIVRLFDEQNKKINRLWNIGRETADFLAFIIMLYKPKTVLELGTSNGFSTFHLALLKETKVISVDVETARQDLAKETLKDFKNIEFITQRIEDYIPTIDYEINLLFIDANKTNYLKYLQQLEFHLSDGAIVIADNIDSHKSTIKNYKEYVSKHDNYNTIHLSIDDGLLISIYKKESE